MDFDFPFFLSQFQYLFTMVLSMLFIVLARQFSILFCWLPAGIIDSKLPIFNKSILIKVLPMALLQFVGKYFGFLATSIIPLPTISSIRALSPLIIVCGYKILYNIKFPIITYLSLLPLLFGVIIILSADGKKEIEEDYEDPAAFTIMYIQGLIFCCISTVIFAIQNIYGKKIISWNNKTPEQMVLDSPATSLPVYQTKLHYNDLSTSNLQLNEKFNEQINYYRHDKETESVYVRPDRFLIIFYCSLIGFTFSFSGFLFTEFDGFPWIYLWLNKHIIVIVVVNCLSHFFQTLLSFYLLGHLPALSYSIASLLKRIVIITLSMSIVTTSSSKLQKITGQQVSGLILITAGLLCYDRWGSRLVHNSANRNS